MTKQEKIMEGIAHQQVTMPSGLPRQFVGTDLADRILQYLHSQCVVIKVERELPKDKDCTQTRRAFIGTQERHAFDTAYFAAQQDMLKVGYVAVESLIK